MSGSRPVIGRFAPSPSGRMHLGNIFTAVLSWLSVRKRGGKWILRIEDLDPQRSKPEHAEAIEDDLRWLGLDHDEGGLDNLGDNGPYAQSQRHELYAEALGRLKRAGTVYPCFCRRADIMATQAPHQSDGRIVYAGTCRPADMPVKFTEPERPHSIRIAVPDKEITFTDRVYGQQQCNPAEQCGDFVLQRADGAWSYQLAVVVDDAAMGVTEVVRGSDLLLSSVQQICLYEELGFDVPEFSHVPLVVNADGVRLSKRDTGESMAQMRIGHTPDQILGAVGYMACLTDRPQPATIATLLDRFSWDKIPRQMTVTACRP